MGGVVPHVELSLVEDPSRHAPERVSDGGPVVPHTREPRELQEPVLGTGSVQRWAAVVATATEASLVLDASGAIVAASASCAKLIGLGDAADARGRRLRDAGLHLIDFTASPDELDSAEADKIPPLLAISSGGLARGLMRVACPDTKITSTMDAIATPLWEESTVVGSLTFFARI
jgi:PAS domain-containing protein